MQPEGENKITSENLKRENNTDYLNITAAWSGYSQPYVQNIVKGGLKAMKLLATLTFDPALFMWLKGLEGHLKKRMAEAEAQKRKEESYKF